MQGLTGRSIDGAAMYIAARTQQRMCQNPSMENGLTVDVLRPDWIIELFPKPQCIRIFFLAIQEGT